MNERGTGYDDDQSEDDLDWSPRGRSTQAGARGRAPLSGSESGRRRTGLVVGAVVAAAAVGVGAAYVGGMFKKDDPAPVATSTPGTGGTTGASSGASTSAGSGAAPSQSSTASGAASSSASSSAGSGAGPGNGVLAPTAGAGNVGTFYGFADAAFRQGSNPPDPARLGAVFASKSVQAKYWDLGTNKPQTTAVCGATSPNLVIVSSAGDDVAVSFYVKGQLTAQQARVVVDGATQKIASITCVRSVPPRYPAARKIAQYYGGYPSTRDKRPVSTTTYVSKAVDGPVGFMNFDSDVCAQYVPQSWVFYAPTATTSGDAWWFSYDGDVASRLSLLFTDPSTGDFERTLCGGLPVIPARNDAAAGKENDPASLLVSDIYDAYIYERSQQSAGAVPVDEMAPYFVSADSYRSALKTTGSIPFLCATKAPNSVRITGTPTVAGGVETLSLTAAYSDSPTPGADGTAVGRFTVSVDLATMKIKALTCV
ncbi:MAG: hypothetical protein HOV83_13990 [Catenulispora sp.]|nr:hypothetical protein [Catenulispora sp.]